MIARCERCQTEYVKRAPNQTTCSLRCKRAGERARRALRAGAAPTTPDFSAVTYRTAHNPDAALLQRTAEDYVLGYATKPSLFTGAMPEWQRPAGVSWNQTPEGGWLMEADAAASARTQPATETTPTRQKDVLLDILGFDREKVFADAKPVPNAIPSGFNPDAIPSSRGKPNLEEQGVKKKPTTVAPSPFEGQWEPTETHDEFEQK